MIKEMQKRLGDILIEKGFLTQKQLAEAITAQEKGNKPLGQVVIDLQLATESEVLTALAAQQDVAYWDLIVCPPTPEALQALTPQFCIENLVLPVGIEENSLYLAMRNPGDVILQDNVFALTGMHVVPVQASDEGLARVLQQLAGDNLKLTSAVDKFMAEALNEHEISGPEKDVGEISEEDTRPVIGLVNQIIAEGITKRASDIHLEPGENQAELRYRIDGRLVKERDIPLALMPMVAARIMIMADMDIANRRVPQDGHMVIPTAGRKIDLRVSLLPTQYGPRMVIRILDRTATLKNLTGIGFNSDNLMLFRELIEKPYGIILVTGPTGSGKTTTLYTAINEIKCEQTNIVTCEDPIEYSIPGISQSQVNVKAGLTFAAQLRAILRQDPDVILVGELRDLETIETAIRAALTGHLVLSTLHSNDAAGAIPRALDMGIEPYLLSSALVGVVAQRLLRALCLHCREEREANDYEIAAMASLGRQAPSTFWHAMGCAQCNQTGYSGRFAVHEVLPVGEEVSSLIAKRESTEVIRHAAEQYGFRCMQQDALDRVESGLTTMDEAKRFISFDTFGANPHKFLKTG